MNDWWDHLEHSGFGTEQANHKYYARVAVGTRGGRTVYRYFYSKSEYDAYGHRQPTRPREKRRLTGEYGSEKHPNGRTANYAIEQYTDENGKFQTRNKYVSREEADKLRDAAYRKEKAQNETEKEKKKRMKDAKKRYKKATSATRRKRAVQKGLQTVSRLMGKQLDYKKKPETSQEKKQYKKAKWSKGLIPGTYSRKLPTRR